MPLFFIFFYKSNLERHTEHPLSILSNFNHFSMESIIIIDVPQPTKIIVKKKADEHDMVIGKKYLIGIDGGLSTAQYLDFYDGIFFFDYKGHSIRLDCLDSVYVI
jgi:hypothetical protein